MNICYPDMTSFLTEKVPALGPVILFSVTLYSFSIGHVSVQQQNLGTLASCTWVKPGLFVCFYLSLGFQLKS